MVSTATLSPCGVYRYDLTRVWDRQRPLCLFLMLNPSTADAERSDPTVTRCLNYAHAWGYGGQYIMVFRDLDLVVVTTSSTTDSEERRGYRRELFQLIERDVLAPVAAAVRARP